MAMVENYNPKRMGVTGMDDNTIICRCEDLTLGELRRRIKEGYISWEELKRITRCGMGSCQGKTCRTLILRELAQAGYKEPFTPNSFRQPIAPVTLGDLKRAGGGAHE